MKYTDESDARSASGQLARLPMLLYAADYPPSPLGGGDLLFYRLLSDYTRECMSFIIPSHVAPRLDEGVYMNCRRWSFGRFSGTRADGLLGRATALLDRLSIPVLMAAIAWRLRLWRVDVVVTVAHGYVFLAATAAARLTGTPLVLFVHDDWIHLNHVVYGFRRWSRPLFRWALHGATHVYAVSMGMQAYLHREFGIDAELQLPATAPSKAAVDYRWSHGSRFQILFAGGVYDTVRDSIDVLVRALSHLRVRDVWELHIYSQLTAQDIVHHAWDHPNVIAHGWTAPDTLRAHMASASLLFVPVSFQSESRHYSETSFPSKLADYLAAGRSVLVIGPGDSTVARHVSEHKCGIVVDQPDANAVADALQHIASEPQTLEDYGRRGYQVFCSHHSVARQQQDFVELLERLVRSDSAS